MVEMSVGSRSHGTEKSGVGYILTTTSATKFGPENPHIALKQRFRVYTFVGFKITGNSRRKGQANETTKRMVIENSRVHALVGIEITCSSCHEGQDKEAHISHRD